MELNTLQEKIFQIGEKLVNCKENCSGVTVDREKGIIPRCLVLEVVSYNDEEIGSVIVGINPGKSKDEERKFYRDKGQDYEHLLKCWDTGIRHLKYYNSLRKLVNELGFTGPILWTELVKSQVWRQFFPIAVISRPLGFVLKSVVPNQQNGISKP